MFQIFLKRLFFSSLTKYLWQMLQIKASSIDTCILTEIHGEIWNSDTFAPYIGIIAPTNCKITHCISMLTMSSGATVLWNILPSFLIRGLKKGLLISSVTNQCNSFHHSCHLSNQQPIAVLVSLIIAHNNISTDFNLSTVLVKVQKLLSFI